jgi:hypothetical protein
MELPPPIFNLDTAAANGADDVQEEGGSAISRSTSLTRKKTAAQQQRGLANAAAGHLHDPICFPSSFLEAEQKEPKMVLELADGTAFQGFSFGAKGKSISGECVFQTGECRASSSTRYWISLPSHLPKQTMSVLVGTSL